MQEIKERLRRVGVGLPDILIPAEGIDLEKWAVVACDQYTSEKDYWESASEQVGDAPSTLRLIFPECYLEDPEPQKRIVAINKTMQEYIDRDIFTTYKDSFFLIHRTTGKGPGRWGLIVALDLDRYDYAKDSRSLIRATEGTILSRIPPRKEIRKNAPLELPHIMVLVSDEKRSLIESLAERKNSLRVAYDTPLMKNGGHLTAWVVDGKPELDLVVNALETMYGNLDPKNPLLFAMGDGNHSFATAKSCWEDIKKTLSVDEREKHPARYALVELENIFDPGLEFEPIHRVLFKTRAEDFLNEVSHCCASFRTYPVENVEELLKQVNEGDGQRFGYCDESGLKLFVLTSPCASIAAGTLQVVIDNLLAAGKTNVDYIHGIDVTCSLGGQPGNIGLLLPDVSKDTFFDTIIADNALPRKTFSMGEAHEKRYYMEARKIR
ncbi:MAG: DUF1015 domain-containing protein [Sphaerochaetaceae bacterium]|nr:DUF1015 domain-containing protein [Sphaerochaetaceae bacterium]